jgi:hypothetical protein
MLYLSGLRHLQQVQRILVFWDNTPCHWVGPFAFNCSNVQEEHPSESSALGDGSIPNPSDVENRCIGDRTSNVKRPESPLHNDWVPLIADNILRAALVIM